MFCLLLKQIFSLRKTVRRDSVAGKLRRGGEIRGERKVEGGDLEGMNATTLST
jgi:hypothetical protein